MIGLNLSPNDKPKCGMTSIPTYAEVKEWPYTLWVDIYDLTELKNIPEGSRIKIEVRIGHFKVKSKWAHKKPRNKESRSKDG